MSARALFGGRSSGTYVVMITRTFLVMIICIGLIILIQSMVPKAMAMKPSSNLNEFTLGDQSTRKRKSYALQLDEEGRSLDNTAGELEPLETDTSLELLPLLEEYANMMRSDVIRLDNSEQTKPRERDSYRVKKYNQAIADPPCSCKYIIDKKDFGEHSYPRLVETRNCSKLQQKDCEKPYVCVENMYHITVLRRKEYPGQPSLELPHELKYKWVAERHPVSVGCACTNEYFVD